MTAGLVCPKIAGGVMCGTGAAGAAPAERFHVSSDGLKPVKSVINSSARANKS